MSSAQGRVFDFPNMLLDLGAFAAVAALVVPVLSGARLHRRLRLAPDAGTLVGVVFVQWLIGQCRELRGKSSGTRTGCG